MYTCHGTPDAEGQNLCRRTDDLRSSCSSKALRLNANELRNEEATSPGSMDHDNLSVEEKLREGIDRVQKDSEQKTAGLENN